MGRVHYLVLHSTDPACLSLFGLGLMTLILCVLLSHTDFESCLDSAISMPLLVPGESALSVSSLVSLCAQASQTAEDAMQIMEQMTKEKTETLASLEDTKQTNAKLQTEVIRFQFHLFVQRTACRLHGMFGYLTLMSF